MKICGIDVNKAKSFGVIYRIFFPQSNKSYVGQTWSLIKRLQHYNTLRCSDQPKIYNALNKYKFQKEHVLFEVLDICENQAEMDRKEIWYIETFDSIKNGYNIKEGGSYGRHSPETILKIKETRMKNGGYIVSEEQRQKSKKRMTGITMSSITKNKMSMSRRGVKKSEETKLRMKEYHAKRRLLIQRGELVITRSRASIEKHKQTLAKKKTLENG